MCGQVCGVRGLLLSSCRSGYRPRIPSRRLDLGDGILIPSPWPPAADPMIDLLIIGIPFQQPNKCSYAGEVDPLSPSFQQLLETRASSPKSLDLYRVFNSCWKLSSYQIGGSLCSRSLRALAVLPKSVRFSFRETEKIKSGIFGTLKLRIPPNEHSFPFAGDQAPDRARHFALASCCIYTDRAPGTGLSGCSSHARFLRLLIYRVVQISHSSRIRLLVPSPAG